MAFDPDCTKRWLVANTHPHKEQYAIDNLRRQGIAGYCPLMVKRIRHARRAYDAERPMFPSYVFVDYSSTGGLWRRVQSTYGIRSIVLQGESPGFLPADFVEGLQARELEGVVRKPSEHFRKGERVAIQGGPMDGLIGDILDLRDSERILVLLDFMNGLVRVNVDAEKLRKV